MNILTVDNITKAYGERKLFSNASFYLQEGEKAGIIGINGTGKSTLLKMIAGLEEPDEGKIITANHCMIRFLPQNPQFDDEETVLEAVLRGNRTESNAGYIEADAKSMLTKLGVTEFGQPCGQLSGGQRKRLALVSVLLSPAEILVLDEPTSYLDMGFKLIGEGFILIAQLSYGMSTVLINLFSKKVSPVVLSGTQFTMGGIVLTLIGIGMGGHLGNVTAGGLAIIFHLAMVSAVAYTLWSILLAWNDVSKVAIFGFVNPLCSVILSALILGEVKQAFNVGSLVALVLVCAGIYIVNRRKN